VFSRVSCQISPYNSPVALFYRHLGGWMEKKMKDLFTILIFWFLFQTDDDVIVSSEDLEGALSAEDFISDVDDGLFCDL